MTGWWTAAFVVQWVLLLVLCLVVVALARQVGTLHVRLGPRGALELDDEGPPLSEALKPEWGLGLDGRRNRIGGPGTGDRLILFVSPTCPICEDVLRSLPAAAHAARIAAQVVSDPDLERAWSIPGTPHVVILDGSGVVRAKGTVNDLEQLEGLIDTARRRSSEEGEVHVLEPIA